ncbi:hypothetical protein AKJ09_00409 [Labilithrix luteola]|uniref:Ig-like domain-containing protein n=1 Tax=Labilithrix luteola TaxID=1391654 RepID=A0A0K1PJQ2_9BACT|nr:hypothetical protein AKJ09_00409 [Labilithrix luteola]
MGKLSPAPTITTAQPPVVTLAQVSLACSGTTASDVVHRKHSIKNTTGYTVPKGTIVRWTSNDKGTGSLTLNADLANNASVDVIEPGQTNGYSCTAYFSPGTPDFVVKSITHNGGTATIVVENANPWTNAGASVAKVESYKCVSSLVNGIDVPVPAIPKGGSVTVTASIATADYLQATANANGAVSESNKNNNTTKSNEYLNHCVPR